SRRDACLSLRICRILGIATSASPTALRKTLREAFGEAEVAIPRIRQILRERQASRLEMPKKYIFRCAPLSNRRLE
ncbi:MAG: hypothetical protein R6X07_11735, partial [Desulfatiglandales bacterium]